MPPRLCLAMVVAQVTAIPIVLAWGHYDSVRVQAEHDRYHRLIDEEVRIRPSAESVLRDTVPQDFAFTVDGTLSFVRTIVLAGCLMISSFVLCCLQRGAEWQKSVAWCSFATSGMVLARYFTHW
jgi:hypothetical protein